MPQPNPPAPEASDRSLLFRLKAGSEDAAVLLYARYARRLRELAQAQCSAALAGQVEPEDVVQSVFGSFFRGASQGFYELPAGEELWRLFLVMALNKIRERSRYHRSAKRDVRRTVGGDVYELSLANVAAQDEAAAVLLQMSMDEALSRLGDAHRQVIRLRVEGYEVAEIAGRLGRSKRSTERLLQEARQHLAIHLTEEDPSP